MRPRCVMVWPESAGFPCQDGRLPQSVLSQASDWFRDAANARRGSRPAVSDQRVRRLGSREAGLIGVFARRFFGPSGPPWPRACSALPSSRINILVRGRTIALESLVGLTETSAQGASSGAVCMALLCHWSVRPLLLAPSGFRSPGRKGNRRRRRQEMRSRQGHWLVGYTQSLFVLDSNAPLFAAPDLYRDTQPLCLKEYFLFNSHAVKFWGQHQGPTTPV